MHFPTMVHNPPEVEMEKRADRPFTKSMLPQSRPPWRSVFTSFALQTFAVLGILTLSYSVVKSADVQSHYTLTYLKTEIAPLKHIHLKAAKAAPALRTPLGDIQLSEKSERPAFQPALAAPVIPNSAQPKLVSVPEIEKENSMLPVPPVGALGDVKGPRKPREEVHTGTFGNEGDALAAGVGGKRRSEVAPSGLGVGTGGTGPGSGRRGSVKEASFDQTAAPSRVLRTENQSPTPAIQPVQITFKPRPVYTAEAKKKQIEGDVVLEVVFQASGEITINRVVSGLGFGLDEAAEEAARRIKFTPAHEDGKPIDISARIHILFQLAS